MALSPNESDEALLAAAQRDSAAFGIFYRRHAAAVLSFTVRRAGGAEAGAELMAEVFAAALEGVATFRPDRGPAVAWLFGIARNKLADFHRAGFVEYESRRRLAMPQRAVGDDDLERIERLASLDVSAEALGEALGELPVEQRDAVVARVVHEREYGEISAEAEVTETVVRQRVSRGLAALRNRLGNNDA